MKITIDKTAKTISVEGAENLGEIFKELESLFPNGEWKNYKLEGQKIIVKEIFSDPYTSIPHFGNPFPNTYPVHPSVQPYYPNPLQPTWCGTVGTQC